MSAGIADVGGDTWAKGEAYEPYIGRWSRLVAREFIQWLSPEPKRRWLDVGCGTAALTQTILDVASPACVEGMDLSIDFLSYGRRRVNDNRASFVVADAQRLPVRPGVVDHVVSGLALNFVPQPLMAVKEMARALKRRGVVGIYVWDYAGGMQIIRYFWDAAIALDPHASDLDEARRFPLCNPASLESLLQDAGLRDIECCPIDVRTHFRDFDDYWTPFLSGQGPAPGYAKRMKPERRDELRERLRDLLPIAPDGSIDLTARAFGARGVSN